MNTKMLLPITKVLFIMLLTVAMSSPAYAAFVNGKSEGYAEYDIGYYVNYQLDSGEDVTGQLWLGSDNTNLYLAFIEPLALVDNSYGQRNGSTTILLIGGRMGTQRPTNLRIYKAAIKPSSCSLTAPMTCLTSPLTTFTITLRMNLVVSQLVTAV